MPRATSVKCPNCSAPIDTASNRCEYCGVTVEISQGGTKVVLAGIQCPECAFDNHPSRLFCGHCGAPLVRTCLECGEASPLGFRYCGACGLDLQKARTQLIQLMRQAAIDNGLYNGADHDEEFRQLYGDLALPDEILILGSRYHDKPTARRAYTYATEFMATDRCLYFLQPSTGSRAALRQDSVARRVPYEKIRSLTDGAPGGLLIIEFDSECVAVSPFHIAGHIHSPEGSARVICGFLEPLLPARIQRQW